MRKVKLILEDGTMFEGKSFGYEKSVAGEVVFYTAMTGYPESLTDPSYTGQILVSTYPLIGNYGVPVDLKENGIHRHFESNKIHITGLIISDYSFEYSHWNAMTSLGDWLKEQNIPGLFGIDTRALTKILREKGSMLGKIEFDNDEIPFFDPNLVNLVAIASTDKVEIYGEGNENIVLVDCGVKNNIIRCLISRGAKVTRVPWDYDFTDMEYDGLFLTNGPGDPTMCNITVKHIRKAIKQEKPIMGICLGNQLLGLAAGCETYKLKYGHRSHNQPVLLNGTNRCFITSQNHGFAIANETLPEEWEPLFINVNDDTNEGIRHKTKPFFSTQFHPEASSGPVDTEFLFDDFMANVRNKKKYNMLNTNIKKVIVLGSGALKIGEAGEFDYSGSQALKALKEEGVYTILINPNIATIQTSEDIADKIYFLPVTAQFVEKVIEKERPDGILLAFGGQTALNCGVDLFRKGILDKYDIKVVGTPVQSIINTEDREIFSSILHEIDVLTPRSIACESVESAREAAKKLGFPLIIRAAYTLGGLGSGFCSNEEELNKLAANAFSYSPQILVEESIKGWKEVEYEVVRDRYDNCITVCNMENFDPLGIHTGESIVVAPSQTLSNDEYHKLRALSIKIIRKIGVVGECNVQFALDPNSEDYRVIEVNARLSRSSALASKATGYPLAFVAAKLGLGYGLHELKNSVTKVTTACFEPALDYVVVKIPRWDLSKFVGVSKNLGSSMKSVGEIMAIGRSFEEAIQKGIRMIGLGMHGFVGNRGEMEIIDIDEELKNPTDRRIFAIAEALHKGYSVDKIWEITKIDKWFLMKLANIYNLRNKLIVNNSLEELPLELLLEAKKQGYSDFQIARLVLKSEDNVIHNDLIKVRNFRKNAGIIPCVKQIDTLAGEYPAQTNYLYITYNGTENDVEFQHDGQSVIVLGSGAYRIGSSVEFDWCSVNAVNTIRKQGYRSIMINYNPETVSTDYDNCDRLYFDELTLERVLDICDLELPKGVVLSMGGQIPNNLAMKLHRQNIPILGTTAEKIDNAEDRNKFSAMLDTLDVDQPRWSQLTTIEEIYKFVDEVGFPVLIRPSYVLSGAAMNVVSNRDQLEHFLNLAAHVSKEHPVVVSEFIENAKEIEVDAVAKNGEIVAYAISEHVEFAGVHSGDATIVFPPQKLYIETIRRIKKISKKIAQALEITGPFNIQYLAKDNDIKVIECNLRASRSFPFVSKVLKTNLIEIATLAMLDVPFKKPDKSLFELDYVGVKAPQFSFHRLLNADPVLGVDMASTGEVACIGENFYEALLKSMLSVGYRIPKKSILISSGPARGKIELLQSAKMLKERDFTIYSTGGTHKFFQDNGVETEEVFWPDEEDKSPNALELIKTRKIEMVINIPKDHTKRELSNGYRIRRNSIDYNIPLITNARVASAFIYAICKLEVDELPIKAWNEYK